MSNKLTAEQIRHNFIAHVWEMVYFWDNETDLNPRKKLEGLAFSLLSAIDGCAAALPGFSLCPAPHPAYRIGQKEDYYPETDEHVDISGGLHEVFYAHSRRRGSEL